MNQFVLFFVILYISFSCSKKELLIEPISRGIYNIEEIYEYQYYTISNYKHLSKDSLLSTLRDYVLTHTNTKITDLDELVAFFYKKSMFATYERYIDGSTNYEMGGIYEYRDNLMATVDYYPKKSDKYAILVSELYNEEFMFPFGSVFSDSIALKRKDTLVKDSEKNLIYKKENFNARLE